MALTSEQSNSLIATIKSIFVGGIQYQAIASGTTSASNNTAGAYEDAKFLYGFVSLQFVATGIDAADGIIKLQDSNDGTNWNDITGATITVAAGTSSNMIRYTAFTGRYIRANWAKGSNSAGTIAAVFTFKK